MSTAHEKIARVQKAHDELAAALAELRGALTGDRARRALAVSITDAETSYLWFRSAIHDGPDTPK